MHVENSAEIEAWLLQWGKWVDTGVLCDLFDISERRLRHLCAGFLVSRPSGGYIHRDLSTPAEFEAYCAREQAHADQITEKLKLMRRLYAQRPSLLTQATLL